ncbi:class I SAM-dependent methyltransferase [Rivularia sp. UHCC 0363]|uniref:class I SAM-dependent methyltransferase n=1 Tax=Rivularia sp. UHCC 0363 TaxID=3110244 RepID=UPI002B213519|nr:class I SAM-dependent methyltransferase [Rivularia sp. UHCC 0363]MEA5596191.1 class I SAM-dependent methyltransferase [Rivularia sp. UHCC 0363]
MFNNKSVSQNFMQQAPPDRNTSEEERFQDDYYSYLESPENTPRYKPTVCFLNDAFPEESFSLLDLGCGNAALCKYLPERCDYLGIDHSELAIERCLKLFPQRKFVAADLSVKLAQMVEQNQKFDAIVMAGLLFHSTDKNTLEKKDDQEIIEFCLQKLVSDRGYLVIIVPFCYGNHPNHTLFARAELLQKLVNSMVEKAQGSMVYGNISLLTGLDERVRGQKTTPDWFVADSNADYANIYVGTYMAAWTFISSLKPEIGPYS